LRIAVNTRLLLADKLEGIGWFAYETLKRLAITRPEVEFTFLFDRKFDERFVFGPNVQPVVLGPQARHPILFRIWFDWSVARFLNREKPDLFLSPDGYLSLKTDVKQLAVIHDLNFEHRPEDLSRTNAQYYRKFFPLFARKATRIATVSEFSKADIARLYRIPSDKIDVVPNAASDAFKPLPEEEKTKIREQLTGGAPYFLFVGSLHPRKNLKGLFAAFDLFKKKTSSPHKLLIVGEKYRWTGDMARSFESVERKEDILFSGRLNQSDLARTMGAAEALTFVSLFEGFGIPILEAMQSGTPVITSNVTSMPEVAGGAALLCNPNDTEDVANQMMLIAENPELRKELVEKGLARAKDFSWDKSAEWLWASMEKAMNEA
jgi:glycosyltransferase involved in cell wall biosynthesis